MAGLNVLDTFEDVHAAGDEIEPEAFEQLSAIKGALATANHIPLLAFLHTCCFFFGSGLSLVLLCAQQFCAHKTDLWCCWCFDNSSCKNLFQIFLFSLCSFHSGILTALFILLFPKKCISIWGFKFLMNCSHLHVGENSFARFRNTEVHHLCWRTGSLSSSMAAGQPFQYFKCKTKF